MAKFFFYECLPSSEIVKKKSEKILEDCKYIIEEKKNILWRKGNLPGWSHRESPIYIIYTYIIYNYINWYLYGHFIHEMVLMWTFEDLCGLAHNFSEFYIYGSVFVWAWVIIYFYELLLMRTFSYMYRVLWLYIYIYIYIYIYTYIYIYIYYYRREGLQFFLYISDIRFRSKPNFLILFKYFVSLIEF